MWMSPPAYGRCEKCIYKFELENSGDNCRGWRKKKYYNRSKTEAQSLLGCTAM
jgi:hypothetical protein